MLLLSNQHSALKRRVMLQTTGVEFREINKREDIREIGFRAFSWQNVERMGVKFGRNMYS